MQVMLVELLPTSIIPAHIYLRCAIEDLQVGDEVMFLWPVPTHGLTMVSALDGQLRLGKVLEVNVDPSRDYVEQSMLGWIICRVDFAKGIRKILRIQTIERLRQKLNETKRRFSTTDVWDTEAKELLETYTYLLEEDLA